MSVEHLGKSGRYRVLIAGFLGWMFAGVEMSLMVSATRPAIQDFLGSSFTEQSADSWFSYYLVAFFLGAALGGAVFGWVGDRWGRTQSMGLSILCYSAITGISYFATSAEQLLILRFLACMGVGGMWPSGVALVSEAWPKVSRPILAGLIGTSANVGFLILGLLMLTYPVQQDTWRWVLLFGGSPVVLGIWVLLVVPESPQWLMAKQQGKSKKKEIPILVVFRPPLLKLTLVGIALGTIPLLGGWASGQRLVPWAGRVGETLNLPDLKALTQTIWAIGAVLGSLGGGWLAHKIGRRLSYFLISLGSLVLSLYLFMSIDPSQGSFLPSAFLLGLVSTSFFGWLPYFIPELFPTGVRATGAGVSFNFGRILSAVAVLTTAALSQVFAGDIAKMGASTSLIYVLGMVIVWAIPSKPVRGIEG